jgi:hypothetical protein
MAGPGDAPADVDPLSQVEMEDSFQQLLMEVMSEGEEICSRAAQAELLEPGWGPERSALSEGAAPQEASASRNLQRKRNRDKNKKHVRGNAPDLPAEPCAASRGSACAP